MNVIMQESVISLITTVLLAVSAARLVEMADRKWEEKARGTGDCLKDFPEGPLDAYRKQASFNWKIMALVMEPEKILRFKYKVWKTLENDPLFAHPPLKRTLEEERKAILEQTFKLQEYDFLDEKTGGINDPFLTNFLNVTLGQLDWSLMIRRGVNMGFFTNAVRAQGSEDHHFNMVEAAYRLQLLGCVCITEIGHGTNTRGLRCRATYDPQTQKFILHCPDFEAAKCWAANLGKTATHAFVMAQLYTGEECHGLHGFVIPIRDPSTMLPYPGVLIFDMGEKIGLNGLDNGVMIFDNYAVGRECLLSRTGRVTPDGRYISAIKDPNKRFGASLGNLSAARTGIVQFCVANLGLASTIAIRYSAVRRQFGNPGESQELPVIEYQMQQWRLFPYLAGAYIMKHIGDQLYRDFVSFSLSQFNPDVSRDTLASMGIEMHVLSCTAKPVSSWLARDGAQECREACGGHGYLRAAGIGRIRDDNDANCTYEGDNNVLLQQASNWLITVWSNPKRHEMKETMPLNTLSFLPSKQDSFTSALNGTFQSQTLEDVLQPETLLKAYKWLVLWLLQSTSEKLHANLQDKDAFEARNDSQVYAARTLSIAFFEHYALERFYKELCSPTSLSPEGLPLPQNIQRILIKLLLLYGYWSLEKHCATLYQGGYLDGPRGAELIRQAILHLCTEIKPEAVALVDAISPPDFVLNSALGKSDGNVYKNLYLSMSQTPAAFERTGDWKEIAKRLKANL